MAKRLFKLRIGYWLLVSLGLGLALNFNSCSDVNFSNSSDAGINPSCTKYGDVCVVPKFIAHEDIFTVGMRPNKVDILMVLDNSGSMTPDLKKLADRLDGLIDILQTGGVDWQICHTLTDISTNGAILEWKKLNAALTPVGTGIRVLRPDLAGLTIPVLPQIKEIFLTTIDTLPTSGSGNEQGIIASEMALENPNSAECFRADAALSILLISDEDEKSCGGRCKDWVTSEVPTATQHRDAKLYRDQYRELAVEDNPQFLISLVNDTWPGKTFVAHTIVIKKNDLACYEAQDSQNPSAPAFFGIEYTKLQTATGGILGNVCADSYATQLTAMGPRTKETINSVALKCAPITTPAVSISPATASTWKLVGNKLIFTPPLPEGTTVKVNYSCLDK